MLDSGGDVFASIVPNSLLCQTVNYAQTGFNAFVFASLTNLRNKMTQQSVANTSNPNLTFEGEVGVIFTLGAPHRVTPIDIRRIWTAHWQSLPALPCFG